MMGYSPGDFTSMDHDGDKEYHWEAKDRQINLWNADESKAILRLSYEEARQAFIQLRTCIYIGTGEAPL
jgi:hypothetical protein